MPSVQRDLGAGERTALRSRFAQVGHARVPAFLDAELAAAAADSIGAIDGWAEVVSDDNANARYFEAGAVPDELILAARERACGAFQFHFCLRELTKGGATGLPSPWAALQTHLASEQFCATCADIGGVTDAIDADGALSRITPSNFFGLHWDRQIHGGRVRRLGYVLALNKDWGCDWGGATLLWNEQLAEAQAYRPLFNSLLLFSLPRPHSVAPVAPFVPAARQVISGFVYSPA